MKKIISVILTLALAICALSVSVTSVSAFDPPDPSYLEPYEEIIEPAFREAYSEIDDGITDVSVLYGGGDYALCSYSSSNKVEGDYFNRFGEELYEKSNYIYPVFPSGLFVAKSDGTEFYSLEDAYDKGLYDLHNSLDPTWRNRYGLIGAVNYPNLSLSIYDASKIQLYVAHLTTLYEDYNTPIDERTIDVNNDGEVNILDSAHLQLKLAKLI